MAKLKDVKSELQKIEINLGGRKRRLIFDMNAFGVLEDRFGTVEAAMATMSSGKIGEVKTLLWAGLIHDEVTAFDEDTGEPTGYNITPYQVGQWISSPAMLQELMVALTEAIEVSVPEPGAAPEGKQN